MGTHETGNELCSHARAGLPEPPKALRALFTHADVEFNGSRPWDIQVHSTDVYRRILRYGSLGLGESYMEGLWDSSQLDETLHRLIRAQLHFKPAGVERFQLLGSFFKNVLLNPQSGPRSFQVGKHHYALGNELFEAMLDPTMTYSCGYWREAGTLAEAQHAKLELICRKLELQPGETLLDIGCGWGGLAQYAAERFGVEVLGITICPEQQALARQRCKGLPVQIELMDYRDLEGHYDKVVSVGMIEHVGPKNYRRYFKIVNRLLDDNGLFLLQTIGTLFTSQTPDSWIDRYIFPGGKLPSAKQLTKAFEPSFLLIEDWHSFGQDYDRTLMAWWANFSAAWPRLKAQYGEEFFRMWKYYLHVCAGYFRARHGQLWQLVLAKPARQIEYRSIR
jgi:cyclopropane-fatty-acyl-phospholipid synthase